MRIDPQLRLLKDNFDRVIRGDCELDFSESLDSKHPFVLLTRHSVSREAARSESEQACVNRMRRSLRPVLQHFASDLESMHIVTQKNSVRAKLNEAFFLEYNHAKGATHNTVYQQNVFFVGEKLMFRKNDYGYDEEGEEHLHSSDVRNGDIVKLARIIDVDPSATPDAALQNARELGNTGVAKLNSKHVRILELEDGRRVNTAHYSMNNVVKGSVSTISSTQGSEYDCIVVYIHDHFSRYFACREFYTAITRAKKRVVIICDYNAQNLRESDVCKIMLNRPPMAECVFSNWLKPWSQAPND
jgi:hypothetical protein